MVDDDEFDRRRAVRVVRSNCHPGAIDTAGTLYDAERLMRENTYDLILLDHLLPDGYGGNLLRGDTSKELTGSAVVYLLTGAPSRATAALAGSVPEVVVVDKRSFDL